MTRLFRLAMAVAAVALFLFAMFTHASPRPLGEGQGVRENTSAVRETCDCTFYAIDALSRIGVKLKTIPSVAVNDWHKYPGNYAGGVAHVKDPANCAVLTHEFYHHYQAERARDPPGVALTDRQWFARERDAAIATMHAVAAMNGCR